MFFSIARVLENKIWGYHVSKIWFDLSCLDLIILHLSELIVQQFYCFTYQLSTKIDNPPVFSQVNVTWKNVDWVAFL